MTRPYFSIMLPDGSEYPFLREQGIIVEQVEGAGMPPIANSVDDYALLDGGAWQRSKAQQRLITFGLTVHARGPRSAFYAFRRGLIEALNPHRLCLPCVLRWYGYDGIRWTNVYYDGGLEGSGYGAGSERVMLRLLAPDPFFYSTEDVHTVAYESAFTPERVYSMLGGLWDTMAGGANGTVYALAAAPGGGVYAGGSFTIIGGGAAARVAYWNGTTWSALGAGIGNGTVYALAVAPNGNLYVGGSFTLAGGAAANYIAMWDGANWNTLGAGVGATVWTIVITADMMFIYVGGTFHTAGGPAALHIASWNPVTLAWLPLGAGTDDVVFTLAIGLDGLVYVGGIFLNAGGAPASRIASWNGATWATLRAGVNSQVKALIIDPATGILYAAGDFTTADGAAALGIAQWNAVSWLAMDVGLWTVPWPGNWDLCILHNGWLLAGGGFTYAGAAGIQVNGLALWNGYSWVHTGLLIPIAAAFPAMALAQDVLTDRWYLGGALTGVAYTINGSTTITNPGNANSYPVVTFQRTAGGLCTVLLLKNETTNQTIWLDLDLFTGDTLTLDMRPGQKRAYTTFLGGAIGNNPLRGSQLSTWTLTKGNNVISALVDDMGAAGMTITLTWEPSHWSID